MLELKRGVYIIADSRQRCPVTPQTISSVLVSPSYISLEWALSHYRLIPERVETITAVTSKKMQRYQNAMGQFTYRHIKQSCYNNFIA